MSESNVYQTKRQLFMQFSDKTTLHGFRYPVLEPCVTRRALWAILVISSVTIFLIDVKYGISLYISYPFFTFSSWENVERLHFPAISVCPINQFKAENFAGTIIDKINKHNGYPISNNWTDPGFDVPGDILLKAIYDNSFKIDDIVHDCEWVARDSKNPFMPSRDCGPHNFTKYISEHGEVCYTVNSDIKKQLHVSNSGLNSAYELLFDMKNDDAIIKYPYSGLKVVIHHQDEPQVSHPGFVLAPGFKTFIRMERIETYNLPAPFSTECGEKKLKYHDNYNQKACLLESLTDFVVKKCHCRQPYMPGNSYILPYCSLQQQIKCVFPARELFDSYNMRKSCPVSCLETTFKSKLSESRFLHNPPRGIEPSLLRSMMHMRNKDKSHLLNLFYSMNDTTLGDYIEENIISVVFYYGEMKKSVNTQTPTFSFNKLLANTGGAIRLIIGASILTFFEFIDFFISFVYHLFSKIHRQKALNDNYEMLEKLVKEDEENEEDGGANENEQEAGPSSRT